MRPGFDYLIVGPGSAGCVLAALMASGQITMRRIDSCKTHERAPDRQPLALAA